MKRKFSIGPILVCIPSFIGFITKNDMYHALSLLIGIIISLLFALQKIKD